MANLYRRRLAAAAGVAPSQELAMQEFARRLSDILADRQMRPSDLARQMFGETDTPTGKAAKGRDRISVWMNAKAMPDPQNMKLLADTLQVPVEQLAEPLVAAAVDRERSSLQIIQAAGHPDKVHLKVDKLVTQKTALKVMALLVEDDGP